MKIVKIIKSLIIGILVVVYLSFAISMTLLAMNFNKYGNAEIGDYTFLFINKDIANEKYKEKDLVVTKRVKDNKFEKGDEAFLYKIIEDELTGSKSVTIMIGKVAEIDYKKQGVMLENEEFYSREFVIGETYKVVPSLGGIFSMILNKTGFLIVIIVPIFFIFTAQIYALIVEIKFGDGTDIEEEKKEKKKEKDENPKEKEEEKIEEKNDKEEYISPFKEDKVETENKEEYVSPFKKEDIKEEFDEKKLKEEPKKPNKNEEKTIDELADDFLND